LRDHAMSPATVKSGSPPSATTSEAHPYRYENGPILT
jgi:hypothetical protein